jgi:hypothetical protein
MLMPSWWQLDRRDEFVMASNIDDHRAIGNGLCFNARDVCTVYRDSIEQVIDVFV